MIINVTQQDIDQGVRATCSFCPVALAMNREIKKPPLRIDVTREAWCFTLRGNPAGLNFFPVSVRDFIAHFDAGRPVTPFSFTVSTRFLEALVPLPNLT